MALVGIQENPEAMSVMEPATTVSGETVSVQMLADCLRQVDITLDSIDVISQGARSRGHGRIAAIYDAVLGPLPAIAQRSVWVAVRLDPRLRPEVGPWTTPLLAPRTPEAFREPGSDSKAFDDDYHHRAMTRPTGSPATAGDLHAI
jgi:hypothetical protein